jgi:glycerol-3-phosphate dehydrogenase (NAD(P)+)
VRPINVIGVAGAGAWGVALANAAVAAGRTVILWGRDDARMSALATTRRSERLPGVELLRAVEATSNLDAFARCDAILAAAPAQSTRQMAQRLAAAPGSAPLVACAKGIERGTHAFMTEILAQAAPNRRTAILSGPSFAVDVAAGLPTALTLASSEEDLARALCDALRGPSLRLYHSTDVRGVEIGGAAKNVLAIACGVARGRGLGASALAALVARGFAELRRFGEAFGARGSTLMGLSGLGDLVLTCSSPQSRNFAFGQALGRGESAAEAGAGRLVEGMFTAEALVELAGERDVDMPIAECVQGLIEGSLDVKAAMSALLARPPKGEE